MNDTEMHTHIEATLLRFSSRGIEILAPHLGFNSCETAAKKILQSNRGTCLLTTGFYVNGYAETDGPIGTYFLANGLQKLGYHPIIITDPYCKGFFNFVEQHKTIEVTTNKKPPFYQEILNHYDPRFSISIERCGRSQDGRYYNMKIQDISEFTINLDELFLCETKSGFTLGIGDGGNEIGMGKFAAIIEQNLNITPSMIETDETVIATTSNWGAYGLLSYFECFTGIKMLPAVEEVSDYLDHIVGLGAVDGVSGMACKSVDGFDLNTEKELLHRLKTLIKQHSVNF